MEEFLTVQEMAKILKLSKVYLYKLVRLKQIPFYHINKAVRFHPEEIQEWLRSKRMAQWHRDKNEKGDVGSNATSFHPSEMNSALTFQLLKERCASGELEGPPSRP